MNSEERQELMGLVIGMPEEQVREVLAFAREILAKARIDISYEWSDEDVQDFLRSGGAYLDRAMPWEDEIPYEDRP
jgi:hypothetical protein